MMVPKEGERYLDADDNEWSIIELMEYGKDRPEAKAVLVRSDGSPRTAQIDCSDLKPPSWRKSERAH